MAPSDYFNLFLNKQVTIHLRRPVEYKGKLLDFDEHFNLKIESAYENSVFIGTIILNGGTISAIECSK